MTSCLAGTVAGSDAGERTRTSKGAGPPGPKPGASTSSATPAGLFKDRARRVGTAYGNPEEREQESRESDVTKFEELTEEVREEQKEAAERIAEPLEPDDDE